MAIFLLQNFKFQTASKDYPLYLGIIHKKRSNTQILLCGLNALL